MKMDLEKKHILKVILKLIYARNMCFLRAQDKATLRKIPFVFLSNLERVYLFTYFLRSCLKTVSFESKLRVKTHIRANSSYAHGACSLSF